MNTHRRLSLLPAFALLAALLALVFWLYYPGTSGPPLLDDHRSVGRLAELSDTPEQAWDFVRGDRSGMLGRSVAMTTFVAEELLGADLAAAKLTNIALHLVIGATVAALFALLLAPMGIPGAALLAVLGAGLWLCAPLQVSTVLYLVQRMAQLAALFMLLSLVCYLLWRRGLGTAKPRHGWLAAAGVSAVLGVLSKENALAVVPLLLLLEVCWLQCRDARGADIRWLRRLSYGLVGAGALAVMLLLATQWEMLAGRYGSREFTLTERLLTQPGILWDYVRQFYLPDVARLGIYHDDWPVVTSLSGPEGARADLLAWGGVLVAVALAFRWPAGRKLAFGPLFFLAGHSLESTVWPLELYFEHRNYLPSVGLVLLPLTLIALLAARWREVGRPLQAWLACLLLYYVSLTSSQVQIWSDGMLLSLQHANGHPQSTRANRELASRFAALGELEAALRYSEAAYHAARAHPAASDEHHGDMILRNIALACIAGQPLPASDYRELGRVTPRRPLGDVGTLSVVVRLRQTDRCPAFDWPGFLDHLRGLYLADFDTRLASRNIFIGLGMLANAQQRWADGYAYVARALAQQPEHRQALLMQLHFTTALDKRQEADAIKAQLQKMQAEGLLNVGEQQTLALYL